MLCVPASGFEERGSLYIEGRAGMDGEEKGSNSCGCKGESTGKERKET